MLKPLSNFARHELIEMRDKAAATIRFYETKWSEGGIINPKHLIPYHQSRVNAIERELAKGFDVT